MIYKIQEKWAVCLSYRLKSLSSWFNVVKTGGLMNIGTMNEMKKLTSVTVAEVIRYYKIFLLSLPHRRADGCAKVTCAC